MGIDMFGGILKLEGGIGRGGVWIYDFRVEMVPVYYCCCCCCLCDPGIATAIAVALSDSLGSAHELRMISTTVYEIPLCFITLSQSILSAGLCIAY